MKNSFKKRRLELGMTAVETAHLIGVREGTYTKWERFETIPKASHVRNIETALQSTWNELWGV